MGALYHEFLRACLRSDTAEVYTLLRNPHWNWGQLFQCANQEMVLPALYSGLEEAGTEGLLPSAVSDFLSAVASLNRDRNSAILTELEYAATLLNEIGIQPVLLKGVAYLAVGIYGDEGCRYLLDIDLLIAESDIDRAAEILMQNGFVEDYTDLFADTRHHRAGLRRPGSISIEIHRAIGLGPSASLLPASEVIERSSPWQLDSAQVRLPCPEHLMTHLIAHSQLQHSYDERIWPPLRATFDLVQLQHRFADSVNWPNIENRFRKVGIYGVLALHLLDVRNSLGLEVPVTIRLTGLLRLRLVRRQLLRKAPLLRYLDPIYMFSVLWARRLRVLRNALTTPIGWKRFLRRLLEARIYRRFFTDLVTGRGS